MSFCVLSFIFVRNFAAVIFAAAKFQINSGNMKFYRSFLKKQRKLSGMTLEMYFREKLKEQ